MVLTDMFLIYIAIVIAFFLLGLVIGYVLNPRRKLRKNKEKSLAESAANPPVETGNLGQDIYRNDAEIRKQQQREQRYRNSNSNNYNNYFDSPWSNYPPRNGPQQRR